MLAFNHLIMAVIMAIVLLVVHQFIPMMPVINLLFNFVMLVVLVIYLMQFFGFLKEVLPPFKIFK